MKFNKKMVLQMLVCSICVVLFMSNIGFAYSGTSAGQYADRYAINPNPAYYYYGADCTNFTSQALYAGGWPFVNTSYNQDNPKAWYYNISTPTFTWTIAKKLYTFIVLDSGKGKLASQYAGTTSTPYPSGSSIGDPIFFDWTSDVVIDHASIYAANGTDPQSGYSGALIDQHTENRYHAIWTNVLNNRYRSTTTIFCTHINY